AQAEYLRSQCETRMTRERTQYLRGYSLNSHRYGRLNIQTACTKAHHSMQYRIHREGDAQNTPASASTPVDTWERTTLRDVLLAAAQEQR
ncbi:hypothetical protein ACTHS8_10860, partial [Neisseria sp. P0016.S008]